MSQLDQIFKISDDRQRLDALIDYARSLKLNYINARQPSGEYSENELAVMIYDAENLRRRVKTEHWGILFGAGIVLVVLAAFIYLLVVWGKTDIQIF